MQRTLASPCAKGGPESDQNFVALNLPIELWREFVFSHLSPARSILCRSVCRAWRDSIPPNVRAARKVAMAFAREGDLDCLEWAASQNPAFLRHDYAHHVPKAGFLFNYESEDEVYDILDMHVIADEMLSSCVDIIWHHAPTRLTNPSALCYVAARGGHTAALGWLRDRGCGWEHVQRGCARRSFGHVAVVETCQMFPSTTIDERQRTP